MALDPLNTPGWMSTRREHLFGEIQYVISHGFDAIYGFVGLMESKASVVGNSVILDVSNATEIQTILGCVYDLA